MAPPTKRRKVDHGKHAPFVEEIIFDSSAREEYLTGFRKRKQARLKQARDIAAKKEREQKILDRKQIREQRKKELEEHVESVNKVIKDMQADVLDGRESWESEEQKQGPGLSTEELPSTSKNSENETEHAEEYEEEDRYTTVTVEPMELNGNDWGAVDGEGEEATEDEQDPNGTVQAQRKMPKKVPPSKPKKKRKQFRYETKAERKMERAKIKLKKSAAARTRREGRT